MSGTRQLNGPAWRRNGCSRSSKAVALSSTSRTSIRSRKPCRRLETYARQTNDETHWHRLVKNIGGTDKNMGEMVAITDESIGVSQFLGDTGPGCPKCLRLSINQSIFVYLM